MYLKNPVEIVSISLKCTYIKIRRKQNNFAYYQSTKNLVLHCHSNAENVSKFTVQNNNTLKTFKTLTLSKYAFFQNNKNIL